MIFIQKVKFDSLIHHGHFIHNWLLIHSLNMYDVHHKRNIKILHFYKSWPKSTITYFYPKTQDSSQLHQMHHSYIFHGHHFLGDHQFSVKRPYSSFLVNHRFSVKRPYSFFSLVNHRFSIEDHILSFPWLITDSRLKDHLHTVSLVNHWFSVKIPSSFFFGLIIISWLIYPFFG